MAKRTTRSRQKRRAISDRNIVGEWRAFVRRFLFGQDTFIRYGGSVAAARELCRRYGCPLCKRRASSCMHMTLAVQYFLFEHGLIKKMPTESYGPGGWARTDVVPKINWPKDPRRNLGF